MDYIIRLNHLEKNVKKARASSHDICVEMTQRHTFHPVIHDELAKQKQSIVKDMRNRWSQTKRAKIAIH